MNTSPQVSPQVQPIFSALSLSPDAVMVTDRRNRIVFWNTSARHLLGYTAEEILGNSCAAKLQGCDVYGNRYCSDRCPIIEMATRNEVIRHFGVRMRAKDRTMVAVDVTIVNLAVAPPELFYLMHVLKPADPAAGEEVNAPVPMPSRVPLALVKDVADVRAHRLTQREVEVLRMMASGLATRDIATRLHISPVTARNHIQNILEKLELHSKSEAVAFAFQKKLM